jgi:hypothetical protein
MSDIRYRGANQCADVRRRVASRGISWSRNRYPPEPAPPPHRAGSYSERRHPRWCSGFVGHRVRAGAIGSGRDIARRLGPTALTEIATRVLLFLVQQVSTLRTRAPARGSRTRLKRSRFRCPRIWTLTSRRLGLEMIDLRPCRRGPHESGCRSASTTCSLGAHGDTDRLSVRHYRSMSSVSWGPGWALRESEPPSARRCLTPAADDARLGGLPEACRRL